MDVFQHQCMAVSVGVDDSSFCWVSQEKRVMQMFPIMKIVVVCLAIGLQLAGSELIIGPQPEHKL